MIMLSSSTRGGGKNSYLILAPLFIMGAVVGALARHAKTLLSTEEDKVEAQNRLYAALETQMAKPRHDGACTVRAAAPPVRRGPLADDREPRQHGEPRQHLDHDYEHAAACAADARRPRAPAAAHRAERARAREHVV